MLYHRITDIEDPYFRQMHELMHNIFPSEEVMAFELWAEPVQDPGIRMFVAIHEGVVVGATEYRYYPDLQVAMTDFTIIGREGLGIGPFLAKKRMSDLRSVVAECGGTWRGMFAEIYNPYVSGEHGFGGVKPMNPYVRREVLAHLGYRKLDIAYVHPSWHNDGRAVHRLDLCFMPVGDEDTDADAVWAVPASLVWTFLERYYAVLPQKPKAWYDMVEGLKARQTVSLLPI